MKLLIKLIFGFNCKASLCLWVNHGVYERKKRKKSLIEIVSGQKKKEKKGSESGCIMGEFWALSLHLLIILFLLGVNQVTPGE